VHEVELDPEGLIAASLLPKGKEEAGAAAPEVKRIAFIEPSTAQEWAQLPVDPNVKLPDDVQASIARGKAAYHKFKKNKQNPIRPKGHAGGPFFRASVVKSKELQDRRDAAVGAMEKQYKRRHPHMLFLQQAVLILVDLYQTAGVPFGIGPDTLMNKLILDDLKKLAARSRGPRKSCSAPMTAYQVRNILRKIKHLGD
jgi:hypothetical protein